MQIKRTFKKTFNDINMTPFVDIVLVLLIIFMVTAPMLNQGIKINLPSAKGGDLDKNRDEEPIVISLRSDQSIYLNSQEIPTNNLENRINLMFRKRTDKNVFIKADEKLPYGFVAKIISRLKEGGAEKIGLVTLPPDKANE
ncbi:MAG: ExbD/TolR family protein [Proteobacteria bacterium]|nr:ExbD/TolR family protein [Pseudomonadota bacterium]